MKIVVTTIMKDESPEFLERWAKSALDAHELVLVDTGSTNGAVECARDLGIVVHEIKVRSVAVRCGSQCESGAAAGL